MKDYEKVYTRTHTSVAFLQPENNRLNLAFLLVASSVDNTLCQKMVMTKKSHFKIHFLLCGDFLGNVVGSPVTDGFYVGILYYIFPLLLQNYRVSLVFCFSSQPVNLSCACCMTATSFFFISAQLLSPSESCKQQPWFGSLQQLLWEFSFYFDIWPCLWLHFHEPFAFPWFFVTTFLFKCCGSTFLVLALIRWCCTFIVWPQLSSVSVSSHIIIEHDLTCLVVLVCDMTIAFIFHSLETWSCTRTLSPS